MSVQCIPVELVKNEPAVGFVFSNEVILSFGNYTPEQWRKIETQVNRALLILKPQGGMAGNITGDTKQPAK